VSGGGAKVLHYCRVVLVLLVADSDGAAAEMTRAAADAEFVVMTTEKIAVVYRLKEKKTAHRLSNKATRLYRDSQISRI